MPRLDPVLDEVLELPARQPAVEALPERVAAGSRLPRAGDLQSDDEVDRGAEEGAHASRVGAGRGKERRVADVLEEEKRVRPMVDARDGEGVLCEIASDVHERQLVAAHLAADLFRPERQPIAAEQHRDDGRRRRVVRQPQPDVASRGGIAGERLRGDDAGARAERRPHGHRQRLERHRLRHRPKGRVPERRGGVKRRDVALTALVDCH